jgi:hypothetical protein
VEPPLILLDQPANRGTSSRSQRPRPGTVARLAVLIHLILVAVLVLCAPQYRGTAAMTAALAVPLAQVSLVAVWAGTRRMMSARRWAVALAGTGWGWLVAIVILPGIAVRSTASAGWAVGLGTQAATILVALAIWPWRRPLETSDHDASRPRRRAQYTVGSLLGWVTLAAVLLSVGKTATLLGCSDVAQWHSFRFVLALGFLNALDVLLVVWSLSKPSHLVRRSLIAAVTLAALACLEPLALALVLGGTGGLTPALSLVLAAVQAVILYATLFPLCTPHAPP